MLSSYPVLDNRPIDQWKVTELKEELKKRKLKSSGKKDDLIRLLDQAIRIERENAMKESEKVANIVTQPESVVELKDVEKVPSGSGKANVDFYTGAKRNKEVDNVKVPLDINTNATALGEGEHQEREIAGDNNENVASLGQGTFQEGDVRGATNPTRLIKEPDSKTTTMDTDTSVTESVVVDILSEQELQNSGTSGEKVESNLRLEIKDSKPQLENEDQKILQGDAVLETSAPDNQVSEVSPNLGSQVKSDSISTDSVSINEKIELKDNIIADNVKLELDVNKPDMVEPPSTNVVPISGESHSMDVKEPLEKASVKDKDDSNATNAEIGKKIDSADLGYSEKLNLDRSSGDDSMEEDVLETKQIDSKDSFDEVRDGTEKKDESVVKEESPVDVVGDGSPVEKKQVYVKNKSRPVVAAEKRKNNDQEAVGNNEPSKRQCRWKSENLKLPEQTSSTPTSTPRDSTFQSPVKHSISRSDSAVSEDAPKERVVPPSSNPPTNSLRIDHFVRPFTLKAVQELLGKTGTFTSFWMDHIKTHCYITYSSVEEAIETRNALYNIQWPPNNGGRPLVAEFVNHQEVKMRIEPPPHAPATPVSTGSIAPPAPVASQPQPSPRQPAPRQQLPPPPPPPISNPPPSRERFTLPPPPPLPEKLDPPIVTLDDLFQKTKATPRIYYLPLSEEQVAAKLQSQSKNTKQ